MNWKEIIDEEKAKPYYQTLKKKVETAYASTSVYPPHEDIFNCFKMCPYESVKVVILGQDPYHQKNQAQGLSFSVNKGIKIPPSLVNIYKELQSDLDIPIAKHGSLVAWAKQGVLLLNAVLSVEDSKPNSHRGYGWEIFNDRIMQELNCSEKPIVFILWGKNAQEKEKWITNPQHLVLKSVHPSPLSAYQGFFGSRPFSKANAFLKENQRGEIDWHVE